MKKAEIIDRIDNLNVWKRGGIRAPHKPLLLLYALGRLQNSQRLIPYAEIDQDLKKLLREFDPARKSYHPEFPFWHLQSDGLWELDKSHPLEKRKASSSAKKSELLKHNVSGGLPPAVFRLFASDKQFSADIATRILENNFPPSIHEDILQAVGLDIENISSKARLRDPNFRERILRAYQYQCAVCGFNVRVGDSLVALEAAHIKWHQAGGPDEENNGLALCSLHHKLFDRGAFTITAKMKMVVSETAHGSHGMDEWLLAFHGKDIRPPQRSSYYPKVNFVNWHVKEVFKGYARVS